MIKNLKTDSIRVAINMSDGTLAIMEFLTKGRGSDLPWGATWIVSPTENAFGLWSREPSEPNLFQEIHRSLPDKDSYGNPQARPMSWKVISLIDIPNTRANRAKWRESGGKIK